MAFPRRSSGAILSAPRLGTVVLSVVLVAIALLSLRIHLPFGHGFVASHRLWLMVAGYAVLIVGNVLPQA